MWAEGGLCPAAFGIQLLKSLLQRFSTAISFLWLFLFLNLHLILNDSKSLSLCLSVLLETGDFKIFTLMQMKAKLQIWMAENEHLN